MLEVARVPLPRETELTNTIHARESLRQQEGEDSEFGKYLSSREYDLTSGIHGLWGSLRSPESRRLFLMDCADYFPTRMQGVLVEPGEYLAETDKSTPAGTVTAATEHSEEWVDMHVLTAYLSAVRAIGQDWAVLTATGHIRSHMKALVKGELTDGYGVRAWKRFPTSGSFDGKNDNLIEYVYYGCNDDTSVHEGTYGVEQQLAINGIISRFINTDGSRFVQANKLTVTALLHKRFGGRSSRL